MRFSDPTDFRLDKFILSILWERKALPRLGVSVDGDKSCKISTTTDLPVLITQGVS